ncbi:MAG: hypothetical protein QOE02_5568 [Rhodospirillaceae bacterium]|nr:hypothetical protein [Rhodospirillaceae bacterium]
MPTLRVLELLKPPFGFVTVPEQHVGTPWMIYSPIDQPGGCVRPLAPQQRFRVDEEVTLLDPQRLAARLASAVVPQIDHRIGKGLQCVVQRTEGIKAQQQAPELNFTGEQPLDG